MDKAVYIVQGVVASPVDMVSALNLLWLPIGRPVDGHFVAISEASAGDLYVL